jgi:hypothetical protein
LAPAVAYYATVCATLIISVLRLGFIALVVVPFLAVAFITIGVLFHIPRMFAAFAVRPVMVACLWHVERAQRRRNVHYNNHHHHAGKQLLRTGASPSCAGRCCAVCMACKAMCPNILAKAGTVLCCTCNMPMRHMEKEKATRFGSSISDVARA